MNSIRVQKFNTHIWNSIQKIVYNVVTLHYPESNPDCVCWMRGNGIGRDCTRSGVRLEAGGRGTYLEIHIHEKGSLLLFFHFKHFVRDE